jgi:hypothetical protein
VLAARSGLVPGLNRVLCSWAIPMPARLVAGLHLGGAGPHGETSGSPRGWFTPCGPVWVDLDGDQIVFMTSADMITGKTIVRDPRVSLCWDDERPPFSFMTLAGPRRHPPTPANCYGGRPASAGGT